MEQVETIGQVMRPAQDIINQNEELRTARRRMETDAIRSLIVVDVDIPVGILEWRHLLDESDTRGDAPVQDIMTREFPRLTQDMPIADAETNIASVDIDRIPVVDDGGHLVGVVPRSALLRREETTDEARFAASDAPIAGSATAMTPITKGMSVSGSDGSKIGEVSDLAVGLAGQLEALIVSHGLFGRKHKRVPVDVVSTASESGVSLAIGNTEFKALPDIEQSEANA